MKNDENTIGTVLHRDYLKPLLAFLDGQIERDQAWVNIKGACSTLTEQIKRICNEKTKAAQDQEAQALMLLAALRSPEGTPVRAFAVSFLEAARADLAATEPAAGPPAD